MKEKRRKRGPGRPALPNPRDRFLAVRLTPEEWAALAEEAARKGVTRSAEARRRLAVSPT